MWRTFLRNFIPKRNRSKGLKNNVWSREVFLLLLFSLFFFFFFYLGGDILASLGADGNSLVKTENG